MRLFALRYAPVLGLLCACSIYDESLLGADADSGSGSTSNAGGAHLQLPGEGKNDQAGGGSPSSNAGVAGSSPAGKPGADTGGDTASEGGGPPDVDQGGNAALGGTAPGQAGNAGTGGSVSPPTDSDVLDDMEDGNRYLFPQPPRYGFWYVAGDATVGAKLPKIEELVSTFAPARGDSSLAVHFTATGFKDWGASVGLSFTDSLSVRGPYDAGNALGISFWVKGSVVGNAKLRVAFPTLGSDPTGKKCGGASQGDCLDHFATQVSVSADWKQVTVLFSSLHQAGWGAPIAAFQATEILGIEWTSGAADLDIWLDDLALARP